MQVPPLDHIFWNVGRKNKAQDFMELQTRRPKVLYLIHLILF